MKPLKSKLDATDWAILSELQQDARLSYAELGRRVNLSSPAVQERVRRLEDAGVITGYHAKVNPKAVGLDVMAIIRVENLAHHDKEQTLISILREIPEVSACYQVTGQDEFFVHLRALSVDHLTELLSHIAPHARIITSMVIRHPIDGHIISLDNFPYLTEDSE
ncbi:MAG: Lrp/AsnC family transcriptional regulator, partial [Chloroflexota bacterium]